MVKAAEPAAETPEGGAQKEAGWGEFLQSNSSQLAILSVGMAYMLTWASDSGKARGWGAKDASGTRAFGVGAALGAAAPQPSLVCAVQTLFWFLWHARCARASPRASDPPSPPRHVSTNM